MAIVLTPQSGGSDGMRGDFPLNPALPTPISVDATRLASCHPMFAVRLRLPIDWHRAAGREVAVKPPIDPATAHRLADLGVSAGLPATVIELPEPGRDHEARCLPVRLLTVSADVDDVALHAEELLQRQADPFGSWGNAIFMAVGELCGNAMEHGRNDLGTYIAAEPLTGDSPGVTFGIVDLGIGIPEHIRSRYPEWYDDTAAITQALEEGVSGTGRSDRGNGYTEVFAEALQTDLVRNRSAADLDIRSSSGRVGVELVGGVKKADRRTVGKARRGTWITYTITGA